MSHALLLADAIASVPAGPWAVAVSGGADSVALLCLLRARPDLSLHVVHLDHELRGNDSTDDAAFVGELAANFNLPCTIALRSHVEADIGRELSNPSARYRAARMDLYRRVVNEHGLQGVILAHHADDQAETILHRLIRGSGSNGLGGMTAVNHMGALLVLRPLLGVYREQLREHLRSTGQDWREDVSNQSDQYLRNRLRRWLRDMPAVCDALLKLADACRELHDWTLDTAPPLQASFRTTQMQSLPTLLARESARRWLISCGGNAEELTAGVLDRLIEMACDAASPPRLYFPGNLLVLRRAGRIEAIMHTGQHP